MCGKKSKYDPQKHNRQSTRLRGYDYSQAGAYFVTMVTYQRACLFGEIVEGGWFEPSGENRPMGMAEFAAAISIRRIRRVCCHAKSCSWDLDFSSPRGDPTDAENVRCER